MRPNVRISDPRRLDTNTASKIARQMLKALEFDREKAQSVVNRALRRTHTHLGSPVAQRRFYERLRKAFGIALLGHHIETGKRGKFTIGFDLWIPVPPPGTPEYEEAPADWLSVMQLVIKGTNAKDEEDAFTLVELVALSNHTIVRLIQRIGVDSPEGILDILHLGWPLIKTAMHAAGPEAKHMPQRGQRGWLIPLIHNDQILYLVINRHHFAQPSAIISTVLDSEMVNPSYVFPEIHMEAFNANDDKLPYHPDNYIRMRNLFDETRTQIRRKQ